MIKRHFLGLSLVAAAGLSACDSNSTPGTAPGMGALQVINAISDSQPIDATVENVPTSLNNIAFTSASGFQDIPDGSYKVQLSSNYNGTNVEFTADNVSIDHNNQTLVFAVGTFGASTQGALVVEDSVANIPSDTAQVQFIDVAGAGGTIELLQPGTSTVVAQATLQPAVTAIKADPTKAYSQLQPVPPGNYEVVITYSGVKVFDSGATGVPIGGGVVQRFVVFNDVNVGDGSAIQVWLYDSQNNKTQIQPGA